MVNENSLLDLETSILEQEPLEANIFAPGRPVDPNDMTLPDIKPIDQQVKETMSISNAHHLPLSEARKVQQQQSWKQTLGGRFTLGALRTGIGLAELPRHFLYLWRRSQEKYYKGLQDIPEPQRRNLGIWGEKLAKEVYSPDSQISKAINRPTDWVVGGMRTLINTHPEWQGQPPENFIDLITSPKKLAGAITESIPMLVGAGILTATGHPIAAFSIVYAAEGQEAYDEAIEFGATPEEAEKAKAIYGSVAAAIEMAQLTQGIALAKGSWAAIHNRVAHQAVKSGKPLSRQFLLTLINENVEEWAQGTWQERVAKEVYGKEPEGGFMGFLDRRLQESAVITALTVATGGVGAAAGVTAKAVQAKPTEAVTPTEPTKPTPPTKAEAPKPVQTIKDFSGSALTMFKRLADPFDSIQEKFDVLAEKARQAKPEDITEERYYERMGIKKGDYEKAAIYGIDIPTFEDMKSAIATKAAEEVVEEKPAEPTPPAEPTEIKLPKKADMGAGELRERGFVTSVKEQFPELETRVSGQYVPRSTDNLAIKARNLIGDDVETAEKMARTGTNDDAVAVASELIKYYTDQAEKADSVGTKNTLLDKAAEVANTSAEKLTELGRAVQAASILGRLTPEGQLRFAQQVINRYNEKLPAHAKKVPNLTTEQTNEILERAKDIKKMPDGVEKAEKFWELQNYISDLVPSPFYKKLINIWKAGLLTGIKTSGLNTLSNLFHGVSETIKDIPAAGIDSAISVFTGKRTVAFTTRGTLQGIKEGFEKGWHYLRTGFEERKVSTKYDYKKVNYGKSRLAKGLQSYEQFIFHIMGAEDEPFFYGAKARSLYDQAIAEAKNRGLKGKEADALVDKLVENPTDDMLKYANQDAERAVYQNRTMLGDIGKQVQKVPGMEFIVPFSRTPSAVATQIINYSPVGAVKTIAENIGKGKFDQRAFSQGLGRSILGTGALYIGGLLFRAGLMCLDRPKNEREQKLWELEGRSANSIKIGNKWRSVWVLGPVGNLLLIGGHFANSLDQEGSPTAAIVTAISGGAKSFTEQTFLRGVNQAVDALQDPERSFESFFSSLVGSFVPTIVADLARATDTIERRTAGPIERLESRVPGLRQRLEPRVDVFGQDLPRYGGNALEIMADPTRPAKIRQDEVVDELRRLWDADIKVSPTLLGDKEGYKGLTAKQNTQLWQRAGELSYYRLFELIHDGDYTSADDEEKGKLIEDAVREAKNIARAEMVNELILSATYQDEKLEELRENKLLTQEVEKVWKRLF